MSTYVNNSSDPVFYKSINKKYVKYKITNKKKSMEEICFPKKFEKQMSQLFPAQYINPKTPYRGILIWHKIGGGKTCAGVSIAENFKGIKRIIVVTPAALIGNFKNEILSACTGEDYLTDKERNTLKKLHPTDDEYKRIIGKAYRKIDEYYHIYSYNKFVDMLQNNELRLKDDLLIIDEVHNMVSEHGTYYSVLSEAIDEAHKDLRIVLMTATPIYDKPVEIALTMNLLIRDKKKRFPIGSEFYNTFMKIKKGHDGRLYYFPKNMHIFKEKIAGYISYFRGAPPYTFPDYSIKYVKVPMSNKQYSLYKKILKQEKSQFSNIVNDVDISNSFFIGTRMTSNFVYPNNKYGEEGYDSLKDSDLDKESLEILGPKMLSILRKTNKAKGPVFITSNFKEYGGIKVMVRVLERHGYKNYQTHGEGRKRFAIWSGDENSSYKEEIKAVFNNQKNADGSKIKIMLGSSAIKEGVTLLRVQQVHLLEPYWNFSQMDQKIGRAIRYCSHKDVEEEKRFVKVYVYLSVHPKLKMSVDQRILEMAIGKRHLNGLFETAMKEMAIDCWLFKNANVYPGEDDIACHGTEDKK